MMTENALITYSLCTPLPHSIFLPVSSAHRTFHVVESTKKMGSAAPEKANTPHQFKLIIYRAIRIVEILIKVKSCLTIESIDLPRNLYKVI